MKPYFMKCCFCIPLRRGLLIWAYVKLIFFPASSTAIQSIAYGNALNSRLLNPQTEYEDVILSLLVVLAFTTLSIQLLNRLSEYNNAVTFLQCVTTTVPELLDLSFTVLLIVAAHKKNKKMLQVYYFYSITMLAVYILVVALSACNIQKFVLLHDMIFHHGWILELDYYTLLLIGAGNIAIQAYLMLLVRTEVHKLYKKDCIKEKFARQRSTASFKVIGTLLPARPVPSFATSSEV